MRLTSAGPVVTRYLSKPKAAVLPSSSPAHSCSSCCCCSSCSRASPPPHPPPSSRPAAAAASSPPADSSAAAACRILLLFFVLSSSSSLPPAAAPASTRMGEAAARYKFGAYKIDAREVFHATDLSYAMVNLRPLLPGLVLVCPKREVKRFNDLSSDETSDFWITAKKVRVRLEQYHKASSLTFAIQECPLAGKTVLHVHIHIMPRKKGDFEKNNKIYDAIDMKERELKEKLDLDIERKDRTMEEMAHETSEYRALFS